MLGVLEDLFGQLVDGLIALRDLLLSLFGWLGDALKPVLDQIDRLIRPLEEVKDNLYDYVLDYLEGVFQPLWSGFFGGLEDSFRGFFGGLSGAARSLADGIVNAGEAIGKALGNSNAGILMAIIIIVTVIVLIARAVLAVKVT